MLQYKDTPAEVKILEAKGKEQYVKSFLISSKFNGNAWRATWDAIKRNAQDFVGKAGVAHVNCDTGTCELDHPTWSPTYEQTLQAHQSHKVSEIVKVELDEKTETAYAIHKVVDPEFGKLLQAGKVDTVSASIWTENEPVTYHGRDKFGRNIMEAHNFRPVHLAWVTEGAYGKEAEGVTPCAEASCSTTTTLNAKLDQVIAEILTQKLNF